MPNGDDVGAMYRDCRLRVGELLDAATPYEALTPVAACPGWRVCDVLGHLVGVVEDALAGRLDGPPGVAQTAAQVARHRDETVAEMMGRWSRLAEPFEAVLSERRIIPALVDVLSHEHDIRTALRRPGARDDPAIEFVAGELSAARSSGVRIVLVRHDGGPTGDVDGAIAVLTTTPFELLRARLGRRTLDEVRALPWSHDPTDVLGGFFIFGPADRSIEEQS